MSILNLGLLVVLAVLLGIIEELYRFGKYQKDNREVFLKEQNKEIQVLKSIIKQLQNKPLPQQELIQQNQKLLELQESQYTLLANYDIKRKNMEKVIKNCDEKIESNNLKIAEIINAGEQKDDQ